MIPDLETNQFLMEAVKEEIGTGFGSSRLWIGLVRKADGKSASERAYGGRRMVGLGE